MVGSSGVDRRKGTDVDDCGYGRRSYKLGAFAKLQKLFHHSPSTLIGEIFELSPINRKGGSSSITFIVLRYLPMLLLPSLSSLIVCHISMFASPKYMILVMLPPLWPA